MEGVGCVGPLVQCQCLCHHVVLPCALLQAANAQDERDEAVKERDAAVRERDNMQTKVNTVWLLLLLPGPVA